jgi:hypothetical protein
LIQPSLHLSSSALNLRRRKFFIHRRGFSGAAGCGMYGLDFVAPNGVIDKMPGGMGLQPTQFVSCRAGAA